jgi:hypothetical protein
LNHKQRAIPVDSPMLSVCRTCLVSFWSGGDFVAGVAVLDDEVVVEVFGVQQRAEEGVFLAGLFDDCFLEVEDGEVLDSQIVVDAERDVYEAGCGVCLDPDLDDGDFPPVVDALWLGFGLGLLFVFGLAFLFLDAGVCAGVRHGGVLLDGREKEQ